MDRWLKLLAVVSLLIALTLLALPAAADDCPPDDPDCHPPLPQSVEVNAHPVEADGSPIAVAQPGSLAPVVVSVPVLERVEPAPLAVGDTPPPVFETLPLRMRWQDPGDVSCGVQALGMALDGLGGSAPASAALLGFLQGDGMMYEFGTGVEELAYAAQSFGYAGATPFHAASLDLLRAELAAGRPVVIALGANGADQPGHFVTVTGFSADGAWVAYNDPTLGERVVQLEEFLRLWDLQGDSGMVVGRETAPASTGDAVPWVALVVGVIALAGTAPAVMTRRKGVGGSIVETESASAFETVEREVPVYGWIPTWKTIQEPVYKKVMVEKTIMEPFPVYKTVIVQDGWDTWQEKVPVYGTQTYISGYRTVTKNVPEYIYVKGRKKLVGYDTVTTKEPIYSTRKVVVDYKTVTHKEPRLVAKKVLVGYEDRPVKVQVEEEKLVGYVEKQVPGDPVWGQTGVTKVLTSVPRRDLPLVSDPTAPMPESVRSGSPPPWMTFQEWHKYTPEDQKAIMEEMRRSWFQVADSVNALYFRASGSPIRPEWLSREEWNDMSAEQQYGIAVSSRGALMRAVIDLWEQNPDAPSNWLNWWRDNVSGTTRFFTPEESFALFLENCREGKLYGQLWVEANTSFRAEPGGDQQSVGYGFAEWTELTWDGTIQLVHGTPWYHVHDGRNWGWVSGDYLAPYRGTDEDGIPLDPQATTYGFGQGTAGWSAYLAPGETVAQYINLEAVMSAVGAPLRDGEGRGWPTRAVNQCAILAVAEGTNRPLEEVYRAFYEIGSIWDQELNNGDGGYTTTELLLRDDEPLEASQLWALLVALDFTATVSTDGSQDLSGLDRETSNGALVFPLVTIEAATSEGRITADGGTAHWVRIDSIGGGGVGVYNPFPNETDLSPASGTPEDAFNQAWSSTPRNEGHNVVVVAYPGDSNEEPGASE